MTRPARRIPAVMLVGSVAALAVGFGGGERGVMAALPAAGVAATAAVPGKTVISQFVSAASRGRPAAMWALLSTPSRRRLGPTLAAFRRHSAVELTEGVGAFGGFSVIVSRRVTPEFGVVAIDGVRVVEGTRERTVYAVALRLEGRSWKVELGSPVRLRPIRPVPGARENVVARVSATARPPGGVGTALMYVDRLVVSREVRGTATGATLVASFDPPLGPGRHTVVVFAAAGRDASATAWAFTVRKR